jgi:integrase
MAWIDKHPTSDRFRICFRWGGRKHKKTLRTTDRDEAEAVLRRFERNVGLVEDGTLTLPPDADVGAFLLSDGKLTQKPDTVPVPKAVTLAGLRDAYVEALAGGPMEDNSKATVKMHLGHFVRTLGGTFHLKDLGLADLQRHVNQRAAKKYRGRPLSPVTLKKEMATFRACWNWGDAAGLTEGRFPSRGLMYPKAEEKPPFMTWEEIERRVARGGLSPAEVKALWDCLYLGLGQVAELLAHVKANAAQGFLYPMCCCAAHTGARRSELIRALVDDVDLEGGTMLIRERKRNKEQATTRRVPLSPFLAGVLRDWLAVHPGGKYLFCHADLVARSKKRSRTTGHRGEKTRETSLKGRTATVQVRGRPGARPLTRDEAHDHFRRILEGSKWAVLRGWHVLRHSFASNCAAEGIDQRLIDSWMGHQTEAMRKRYRHLFPEREQAAIRAVFGG